MEMIDPKPVSATGGRWIGGGMDDVEENLGVVPSLKVETELLGWMALMAISLGFDMVGVGDAVQSHRQGWVVVFLVLATMKLVLYVRIAKDWSRWV